MLSQISYSFVTWNDDCTLTKSLVCLQDDVTQCQKSLTLSASSVRSTLVT